MFLDVDFGPVEAQNLKQADAQERKCAFSHPPTGISGQPTPQSKSKCFANPAKGN